MREFLYVDDLADALVFLMRHYSDARPINVGAGSDISIAELAQEICRTVGFKGDLRFDPSKPDGTPRKLLDSSALATLGWQASTSLEAGLRASYDWFLRNVA